MDPLLTATSEHATPRYKFTFIFITTAQVVASLLLIGAALSVVAYLGIYLVSNLNQLAK